MNNAEIIKEVRRIVDDGITPGQAFDAICNLRRDRVTFNQIVTALSDKSAPPCSSDSELNDDSPFPFGKYKGKLMRDVPATYLQWLWTQRPIKGNPGVEAYIKKVFGYTT